MTELSAQLLHGVAVLLGAIGLPEPGAVLATLGAAALLGALTALLVAAGRAVSATASPRLIAVGDRARHHAVLLGHLPDASHPDARGHTRSRAPGRAVSAA